MSFELLPFGFDNLQEMETQIRFEFLGRLHEFHIERRSNGIALQGRTDTYHRKQEFSTR